MPACSQAMTASLPVSPAAATVEATHFTDHRTAPLISPGSAYPAVGGMKVPAVTEVGPTPATSAAVVPHTTTNMNSLDSHAMLQSLSHINAASTPGSEQQAMAGGQALPVAKAMHAFVGGVFAPSEPRQGHTSSQVLNAASALTKVSATAVGSVRDCISPASPKVLSFRTKPRKPRHVRPSLPTSDFIAHDPYQRRPLHKASHEASSDADRIPISASSPPPMDALPSEQLLDQSTCQTKHSTSQTKQDTYHAKQFTSETLHRQQQPAAASAAEGRWQAGAPLVGCPAASHDHVQAGPQSNTIAEGSQHVRKRGRPPGTRNVHHTTILPSTHPPGASHCAARKAPAPVSAVAAAGAPASASFRASFQAKVRGLKIENLGPKELEAAPSLPLFVASSWRGAGEGDEPLSSQKGCLQTLMLGSCAPLPSAE